MNRRNIFAVAAVAAGLAVLPVAAQKTHDAVAGAHAGRQGRFLAHVTTALNLTDAQQATAKQIFQDTHTQSQPLMEQMKQVRTDMQAAVKANNTAQISTLAARQGQLSGQLAELHNKAMASFYAQLNPDQKAKADELKGQLHQRMARRFGASRHHGNDPAQNGQAQ